MAIRVEIVTNGPNPIMPNNLTNMFMMDKQWAEKEQRRQGAGL